MTELTFVVLSGKHVSSARLKELQDSSARSHAARFAHRRSKLLKLADPLSTKDVDASDIVDGQIEHDSSRLSVWEEEAASFNQYEPLPPPDTISTLAQRDPFAVTPGADLPSYLLDALHFRTSWLSFKAEPHGTRPNSD